jgi:hypothetical protein
VGIWAIALGGCTGTRAPTPAELQPLVDGRPARAALPDDSERLAARVAAAALADDTSTATARSAALAQSDAERVERGEPVSGLADNAGEVVAAGSGSVAFRAHAEAMLERDDLDPATRRRLERSIASDPLAQADARLAQERQYKAGAVFNRVVEPVSRFLISGAANPLDATRTTISTLLTAHQFPEASVRERQALRAWDEWLVRHPDDPRAPEITERAQDYRAKLASERFDRAMKGAEEASAGREFERTRILATRALQYRPGNARATELLEGATSELAAYEARARDSLRGTELLPAGLDPALQPGYLDLARKTLVAPPAEVSARASAIRASGNARASGGELVFLESLAPRARGDEDAYFARLAEVPAAAADGDTVSRQSAAILGDRQQNPYAFYRASLEAESRAQRNWILLGQHANGPRHRDLPRPIEYVLDVPAFAITLITIPIRVFQYPGTRAKFGQGVLQTGERYVDLRPQGQHAEEVHRDLAARYASRGQPGAAMRHELALPDPDADVIARYRTQISEQLLASAAREKRVDMKLAVLATVARDYADTPAGARAKDEFIAQKRAITPQRIRLTHDFLVEHPQLWAPGALELNPELLDGERSNGEIAESGVVLLGRSAIEIPLEGRDPVTRQLPADDFARFVARLEQVSYASLTRDEREVPITDPARDSFLAAARLGVTDFSDARPYAHSEAVFESTHEKHGFVNARESILPVDLVLRGDIETLGLAAFPRIRLPENPADALLYD